MSSCLLVSMVAKANLWQMQCQVRIMGNSLWRSPAKPFCSPVITDSPSVQTEANFLVSRDLSASSRRKAAFIVGALALELSPLNRLVVKRNFVCLVALLIRYWMKQIICSCMAISVRSSKSSPKHLAVWASDKKDLQTASPNARIISFWTRWLLYWKYLISLLPCNATRSLRWAAQCSTLEK